MATTTATTTAMTTTMTMMTMVTTLKTKVHSQSFLLVPKSGQKVMIMMGEIPSQKLSHFGARTLYLLDLRPGLDLSAQGCNLCTIHPFGLELIS